MPRVEILEAFWRVAVGVILVLTAFVPLHELSHSVTAETLGCKVLNQVHYRIPTSMDQTYGSTTLDCPYPQNNIKYFLIIIAGSLPFIALGGYLTNYGTPKIAPFGSGILAGALITLWWDLSFPPAFQAGLYLSFAFALGVGLWRYYEWRK